MAINYKIGKKIKFLPVIPLEFKDLREVREILSNLRDVVNEILKEETLNMSDDNDYWKT